jgi:hypothetical protein
LVLNASDGFLHLDVAMVGSGLFPEDLLLEGCSQCSGGEVVETLRGGIL